MKRLSQQVWLFAALVLLSALLYWIEYLFLHDAREVWVWIASSVAFLPLQVALVTLVIEQVLGARERQAVLRKLNMVIGAFFGEVGIELLGSFAALDPDIERVRQDLGASALVSRSGFQGLRKRLTSYSYRIDLDAARLDGLRGFLVDKREFLLRLLENPSLLEHDTFSDLLWAVFHLADELRYRLTEIYEERRRKDLPDYDIFMAIAEDIGYDATNRSTKVNELELIAPELTHFIDAIEKGKL